MNSTAKRLSRFLGSYLGFTVFLVAVILRVAVGWVLIGNLDADPDAYAEIARSLQSHGVYGLVDDQGIARPTAFRPPLYPWLLSVLSFDGPESRVRVLIMHAILGGWTVLATFLISQRYVSSSKSLLAAGLVAVDPILLMQSTLVMTETLATALSATVLWWCSRFDASQAGRTTGLSVSSRSVVLGTLLTLSYLCRPTFLVWSVLLVFGWIAVGRVRKRATNWRSDMLTPVLVTLIVAVGVGAWTLRNWRAIGHPVWATTHGGYTLLLGNNEYFYEHLRSSGLGDVWDAELFLKEYRSRDQFRDHGQERANETERAKEASEYSDDRWAYNKAKKTIARQPQMFVYSCFVRLGRLWSPNPHRVAGRSSAVNLAVGAFYIATFLLSLIGMLKLRWHAFDRFLMAALALAVTLSLVHCVYWSNMRMRAPLVPAIAVLAAVGCFGQLRPKTVE